MVEPAPAGLSPTRAAGLAAALALPVVGLTLLLGRPHLDVPWEHHPAHFWLVMGTAALAAALAYATGDAAVRRGDARVLYVSIAFLCSAGFLLLHSLATPGTLVPDSNTGFVLATPVGVALGSLFALRSTVEFSGERAVREVRIAKGARLVVLGVMVAWAVVSLAELPPLDAAPEAAEGLPAALAFPAVAVYAVSGFRYLQLWRRTRALMLLMVLSAFVLLAESLLTMALARSWHLSWWEWHLLLLGAYTLVALAARVSWRDERFKDLYLEQTRSGHRQISVLFADLQGFTPYAEAHPTDEVTQMLNTYFDVAVPAVVEPPAGGEVHQIIGDALMVIFNRRGDQPDHARRAAHAGLALQAATSPIADAHPGWPRFRVGVNSGEVSLSVIGTTGGRTLAVVGDVVNTASRIEGQAPAGGVAIGSATKELLPDASTRSLGALALKGKAEPVEAHLLLSLGSVSSP